MLNVLSLFDGMSCGQIALERAGIPVKNYFASEIDKWAIKITQKNYPNTIQLGDIRNWREWDLPRIDLIMGGSPCQGFSVIGKRLNFDDPRSKLFFVFVDILKHYKPRWFLLENVRMKKEWRDIITRYMGVKPIEIDSALVSAQSRKRLYWTNIPVRSLPKDRGILLKDVIKSGCVDRDKSYCLTATYSKAALKTYFLKRTRQLVMEKLGVEGSNKPQKLFSIGKDYRANRVYSARGKSVSLATSSGGWGAKTGLYLIVDGEKYTVRKLTPLECERLQTVPEGYTEGVSNTQRYKMLGNGWTVDVIAHILKGI